METRRFCSEDTGSEGEAPPPMEFPRSTRVALGEVGGRQLAPDRSQI